MVAAIEGPGYRSAAAGPRSWLEEVHIRLSSAPIPSLFSPLLVKLFLFIVIFGESHYCTFETYLSESGKSVEHDAYT